MKGHDDMQLTDEELRANRNRLRDTLQVEVDRLRTWADTLELSIGQWDQDFADVSRYEHGTPTESLVNEWVRVVRSLPFNQRTDLVFKYGAALQDYRPEKLFAIRRDEDAQGLDT